MDNKKVLNEKEKKVDKIGIRLTPEEKQKIKELAESHHISISKLVVDVVINKVDLHNEKACDIAQMLCKLAYEVEYIKGHYADSKEDLGKIQRKCIELWQFLR